MKRRPGTTEHSLSSRRTSYPFCYARLTSRPGCAFSISPQARGSRPKRPFASFTAADLSPAMVERARRRLGHAKNASVVAEDGQALSFSDESFDAVVCSLGLMFFPDPRRGLAEFHRVLRPGGRAAVSVNTVPETLLQYSHQSRHRTPRTVVGGGRRPCIFARRRDEIEITVRGLRFSGRGDHHGNPSLRAAFL